jgi:hypothetical protein
MPGVVAPKKRHPLHTSGGSTRDSTLTAAATNDTAEDHEFETEPDL